MEKHQEVVHQLKVLLDKNPQIKTDLETSLQKAVKLATSSADGNVPLNENLYWAINNELGGKGWPTTIEDYYDYLDQYVRIVPNESNDPDYPNAWSSDGTKNGHNQKIYDLLCQFYWLIDQNVETNPDAPIRTVQSYKAFATWLDAFAIAWGSFLETPESISEESIASFIADPMYNMDWYISGRSSWTSFNKFFFREFNGADEKGLSPLRPIASPDDNTTIVAPADCTYKAVYPINAEGNVMAPAGTRLKHTHSIGTVDELLTGKNMSEEEQKNVLALAKDFYGGTFIHYFLSPFDYHRFHTPVSGKVLEINKIIGQVYLNVLMEGGQFDAPDDAESDDTLVGYEFTQARGIIIIDTQDPNIGKVAVLPIGMCQVSGVLMYDGKEKGLPDLSGQMVVKGQEFGKFKFGGSDIIMLFEKPQDDLYLFKNDPGRVPIHFQYGQTAAYVNK